MKKLLALLLCILMCFAVTCGMAACDDKQVDKPSSVQSEASKKEEVSKEDEASKKTAEELIIGKWETDFRFDDENVKQFVEAFEKGFEEASGIEGVLDYFDLKELSFKMLMEFKEDGTVYENVENIDEFAEKFVDVMVDGMIKMAKEIAKGQDMTYEEYLAEAGTTEEQLIDTFKTQFNSEEIKKSLVEKSNKKSYYQIKDGKLYNADTDKFEEDDIAEEFSVTQDTLVIKSEGIKLEFKRVK